MRAVLGAFNQLGQGMYRSLHLGSLNVAGIPGDDLSASLAARPCHVKGLSGYIRPKDAFLALLDSLSGEAYLKTNRADNQGPLPGNVVVLGRFR